MLPKYGNALVVVTTFALFFVLFSKTMRSSKVWRATVTPLASIIGSGFLVSAPLLILTTGKWAFLAIFVIVIVAYSLGSSIRYNISNLEPILNSQQSYSVVVVLERFSKPLLGIAYIISVAFYLKLFAAFLLRGLSIDNILLEKSLTTSVLVFIGFFGWLRGFNFLEFLEKNSVNIKLIIIASMIIGHLVLNVDMFLNSKWYVGKHSHYSPSQSLRMLLGILIIVQGFETSRYLGNVYPREIRIKTMRYAQIITGTIYVVFIGSTMVMFNHVHTISETVVIDLCKLVAPILPFLLIFAALLSQFSAAVADTLGSAGLISEATKKHIALRTGFLIVSIFGVTLTWLTNIYQIISIASKGFAAYYAIQCLISAILVLRCTDLDLILKMVKFISFIFLFFLMICVIILGIPVG